MLKVGRKCLKLASLHFLQLFLNPWHIQICLSVLCLILFLGCTHNLTLEMKTVAVGDDVILTCSRLKSETWATLHWVRVVSGNWPEFLGGTFAFEYDGFTETPHFTAKQESGNFTLHISKSNLNDSGLYYCIEIDNVDLKILRGTFLRIKGKFC